MREGSLKLYGRFGGYLEHVVDHDVHRLAAFRKKVNGLAQQLLRTCATHARQHNEAGVDGLRGDQCAKVAGVFRDENEIVVDAALQNITVWHARAAKVARVHGDVISFGVESLGNGGREALVEKQPHGIAATACQLP